MKSYRRLIDLLALNEGNVPYMYLDTEGNVTAGIGFMIPSATKAREYPFRLVRHRLKHHPPKPAAPAHPKAVHERAATAAEIEEEWALVRKLPLVGQRYANFKDYTTLELRRPDIEQLLINKIKQFETSLQQEFPKFDSYHEPVQMALIDMRFNLKQSGWAQFENFKNAVRHNKWSDAAAHCERRGIQPDRNKRTKQLFDEAALLQAPGPGGTLGPRPRL